VLIIQNDLLCSPTEAIASLIAHDIQYHVIYAFHDNAFKLLHPLMYEAVMVLGGRAGVYEEPSWLKTEMHFICNALKLRIPILGICLGCQLLAECIGGKVFAGQQGVEIGYKKWKWVRDKNSSALALEHQDDFKSPHDSKVSDADIDDHDAYSMSLKYTGKAQSTPYGKLGLITIEQSTTPEANMDDEKQQTKSPSNANGNYLNQIDDDDEEDDFNEDDIDFDEDELVVMDEVDQEEEEEEEEDILDPIVAALKPLDLGEYIVLFHGDTFTLPEKCQVSGQQVQLLATTDRYNTLFRVGLYSYGFQGHPELNCDMLRVWCKCWGDDFLKRWEGDLEKDVLEYAQKHADRIQSTGKKIFDIWCSEVVLLKTKAKLHSLRTRSMSNLSVPNQIPEDHESSGSETLQNVSPTTNKNAKNEGMHRQVEAKRVRANKKASAISAEESTKEQFIQFLKRANMIKYASKFEENDCCDMESIEFLSEKYLEDDMGIKSKISRQKFLAKCEQLKQEMHQFKNDCGINDVLYKRLAPFGIVTLFNLCDAIQQKGDIRNKYGIQSDDHIEFLWKLKKKHERVQATSD